MPEPKVVNVSVSTGHKIYWCPKHERQMFDTICQEKYFSRCSRVCRRCLGIGKGKHWPEPWSNLGNEEEEVNTVIIDMSAGKLAEEVKQS
jgi:hypothetical protein